jgi:hypothetical protein
VKWPFALRRLGALVALGAAFALPAAGAQAAAPLSAAPASRVEARSNDLLAVGVVHADKMSIHLSRLLDNAPVRDAVISVVLRGTSHPTTAETDGSYTLQAADLALPGAVAVEFRVSEAALQESLKGTLEIASAEGKTEDRNSARQLWWWVLNFAVCIGFLWLFTRRKKKAED